MKKSYADRIKESFDGASRDDIVKYVEWARSTAMDYTQALRRSAAIMVIAVAIFEVVAYSKNQTIQVASFTVARNSLVLVFLPAFVAYFFFQVTADHNRIFQLEDLYEQAFLLWCEKGGKNDLDTPLLGPSPLYWNVTADHYYVENISRADKIENFGGLVMMVVIFFGIIAFEGQAYYIIFTSKNLEIAAGVISAAVTIFCLAMGTACFAARGTDSH